MSNFPLRLPADLGEWAKEEAEREGRSLNSYIVWLLQRVRSGQLEPYAAPRSHREDPS
jgi:predicted HicB family RNase H-like nuclease